MSVVIETTLGDITVDLFVKERPKACLNFLKLCKLKYYNFNLFHTIQQGFIAQTGDPTGDSDKGESVWGVIEGPNKKFFEAEMLPKILHSEPGLLSMVSTDGFIGSQFFFSLGADLLSLDEVHCVIGEVVEGHEVLRAFNEAIVDDKSRPYKDIRITHTVILEDPYSDPRGFRDPSRSPSPTAERLKNGRIAADEDIDDTQGKTEAEVHEMLQEREAKARATILEIVGDIPDAGVAPPENVLFVCKLNPVTTDDDLQIIFSRFGRIKTCEVIRDKVTGDSLQYAFIEFEEQKSCEDAYFKMDNVLIDDRRIHVDFSQSVSKIKWRGKGNYTIHDDDDRFKSEKSSKRGNRNQVMPKRRSRSPRRDFNREERPRGQERSRVAQNDYRGNPRHDGSRRYEGRRQFNSRRQSISPRRRSRSPKRQRSPRRSRSPKRRSRSPKKRSKSPKRKSRSIERQSSTARKQQSFARRSQERNKRDKNSPPAARRSQDRSRRHKDSPVRTSKSHKNRRSASSGSSSERKSSRKHKKSSKKRRQSSSSDDRKR